MNELELYKTLTSLLTAACAVSIWALWSSVRLMRQQRDHIRDWYNLCQKMGKELEKYERVRVQVGEQSKEGYDEGEKVRGSGAGEDE